MKENSLLGYGNSTSVEIPYSSLSFKRDTKKRPVTVTIEVLAFGNSKMIGDGTRYTNVGMYESCTFFFIKKEHIILVLPGKNLCLYLTSILYSRRCLRVDKYQHHLELEVCEDFAASALLGGR